MSRAATLSPTQASSSNSGSTADPSRTSSGVSSSSSTSSSTTTRKQPEPEEKLPDGQTGGIPWATLGGVCYRKVEVFNMSWTSAVTTVPIAEGPSGDSEYPQVLFDQFHIAGAPFGGPIAMLRDEWKISRQRGGILTESSPKMRILSSSGRLISQFPWTHTGLLALGWTDAWAETETLVAVLDKGEVYCYDIYGAIRNKFSLGDVCRNDGVAGCSMWSRGLVVRSATSGQLFAVTNFLKGDVTRLPDPMLAAPTAMTVISPSNDSRTPLDNLTVILGSQKGSVVLVTTKGVVEKQLASSSPCNKLVVSPGKDKVACFSDEGTMLVYPVSFAQVLFRFTTMSKLPPASFEWCGPHAVLLTWEYQPKRLMLLVGPDGDYASFQYTCPIYVLPEIDGVRVLSDMKCEILQPVPKATERVFRTGAKTPGARLYAAKDAFEARDVRADDMMRKLLRKRLLVTAIDQCLEAAAHELHLSTQKSLLRAASFGKLNITAGGGGRGGNLGRDDGGSDEDDDDDDGDDDEVKGGIGKGRDDDIDTIDNDDDEYNSDKFVELCQFLRVINAVRTFEVGIPITYEQFQQMEVDLLISRLKSHREYLLALRICQYLRMNPGHVLIDWACAKIRSADDMKDEELAQLIKKKFNTFCPDLSYGKVALTAHKSMRPNLALSLLNHEPKAKNQIKLLLEIKQLDHALVKAIASGDTDLIYQVLFEMEDTRPFKEFCASINDKPLAKNLYITWLKQTDPEKLKEFYYTIALPLEAAHTIIANAYRSSKWSDRIQLLSSALDFYQKERLKDQQLNGFYATMLEEQMELLKQQRKWEVETPDTKFVDLSVSGLIENYIQHSQPLKAHTVRNLFKVPEKRYWHLEVKTLAKNGYWQELHNRIANKKIPPIGYEPFVEACVEYKASHEAGKYIPFLSDPGEQMEWYCNIGYFKEAADVAMKERNIDALHVIRSKCKNPATNALIDSMMKQLSSR